MDDIHRCITRGRIVSSDWFSRFFALDRAVHSPRRTKRSGRYLAKGISTWHAETLGGSAVWVEPPGYSGPTKVAVRGVVTTTAESNTLGWKVLETVAMRYLCVRCPCGKFLCACISSATQSGDVTSESSHLFDLRLLTPPNRDGTSNYCKIRLDFSDHYHRLRIQCVR
jgi:hypothetical protein